MSVRRAAAPLPASQALERLVKEALQIAKKARTHRQNLHGDNYYANKIAELRVDATNVFRRMATQSGGDVTALAEMMENVFSADTARKQRLAAARELTFSLRTTWRDSPDGSGAAEIDLFPLAVLAEAKRGYLVTVARQMNGSYTSGWYDACAVMMRRLLEISLIEAFEGKSIAHKIRDADGNYLHLSDLVDHAMAETAWSLSRNARKFLPQLRDVGHLSAHGRYYHARKEDIDQVRHGCRVVIEEFLHHAGLL